MTSPTPPRGTQTTLRTLPKALVLAPAGVDGETLLRLVMQEDYLATRVEHAEDALAMLKAEPYGLVLLDLELAAVDGPQFLAMVRADPHLADVPVLLVSSASGDADGIERALSAGADDYLPRRFGRAMLRTRIGAALDRRRSEDNQDLRREMAVARNIQRDFLPEELPTLRGVELEAALHPAKQVSGDFYDAFLLAPSGNLMLVVGDVCDKGVGAALFMALFRSLIRASADPVGGGAIQMIGGRRTLVMQSIEAATPADLLTRVAGFTNNYIARLHGRTNMFATVFLAILDPDSGRLDYVNAGHEPALVIGPDGEIRTMRPTGPALGMMPDAVFQSLGGTLERGHTLLAFTDGLVEARSPTDEAFGGDRLRQALRAHSTAVAPDLVRGVVETLKGFTRQAEPHDDLTMLAVTRT
jgi:sigma-B regulation protein RsbU (phosphoserine phosphatase)